MRDLRSGSELAKRYTLVRKLGAGGGAETWLADDRYTHAAVALKIGVESSADADALRREWQTSIRLVHPHIVRVFEFHEDASTPFFSMQYIDGADLGVLAGAPAEEAMRPVALVADALAYAHGKGIVHRDLKASNVLLAGDGAPFLIDFGVAGRTASDASGGSPIAASPQQLEGAPAAPSDDVFALGGLIYELLAGRSPYSSATTADDIRNRVPTPLAELDGVAVPDEISALVAEMLEKNPSDRPDAETVRARIEAAGIQAGPAPAQLVDAGRDVTDQVIESDGAVHGRRPKAAKPEDLAPSRTGLSPRAVAAGLAILLVLLAGVVFLLPDAVEQSSPVVSETQDFEEDAAADETADDVDGAAAPERDERVQARQAAEEVLGELLAKMQTLEARAVDRWGELGWQRTREAYEAGDAAYLERNYVEARLRYAEALDEIDPLLERVDRVFNETLAEARAALEAGNAEDAVRLFELATAISPSHGPALEGLRRARNLDSVLALMERGRTLERDLELEAARDSFRQAIDLDPQWAPAGQALARIETAITQRDFEARMTEGLNALATGDFQSARAAFRVAERLKPGSPEVADGLLQVRQGLRLQTIRRLEDEAEALEASEQWEEAAETYTKLLELDADLAFAKEGLARSKRMAALHAQLDEYIGNPDSLSSPRNMQLATGLIVDITRMQDAGAELAAKRDELSRLLKRAATPLTVTLRSDNETNVAIYKVGKLGTFDETKVSLKPGIYVAVGSRPGYRDVRLEFRVAPEIDMQPVVVRCEEKI